MNSFYSMIANTAGVDLKDETTVYVNVRALRRKMNWTNNDEKGGLLVVAMLYGNVAAVLAANEQLPDRLCKAKEAAYRLKRGAR